MVNIKQLLSSKGVQYWTEGRNVTRGWVNIRCPFCYDSSNHGGFNPKNETYNCWKCGFHPIEKTISKLLNIHEIKAKKLLRKYKEKDTNDILDEKDVENKTLSVPGSDLKSAHISYLKKRGYDPNIIIDKYEIKGTLWAPKHFKYRIVIPIIYNGIQISYVGRSISDDENVKYKWCFPEEEIISHREVLYNIDNCKTDSIIVCEGALDVWKLGDNSCATMGVKYSREQLLLLTKYKNVFICFDPDDAGHIAADKLNIQLAVLGKKSEIIFLDDDPGDMKKDEIIYLKSELGVY